MIENRDARRKAIKEEFARQLEENKAKAELNAAQLAARAESNIGIQERKVLDVKGEVTCQICPPKGSDILG